MRLKRIYKKRFQFPSIKAKRIKSHKIRNGILLERCILNLYDGKSKS